MPGNRLIQILTLFAASLWIVPAFCQLDFNRYVDENAFPVLSPADRLDVKFKWNMPGTVQASVNEGLNSLNEGNPKLAILHFNESIQADPTLWVSYYYRGICHKNLLQLSEAEWDLLKASKLNPKIAECYHELGEVYQLQQRYEKAAELYRKAIRVEPALAHGYYNLGTLSLKNLDIPGALTYFEKCTQVNPSFTPAYVMKGILKFKSSSKDYDRFENFNTAIKVDPSYWRAYYWRGLAYANLNQTQKCLDDWNTMIQVNPNNFVLLAMRGALYIELGNFENAFSDIWKALLAREIPQNKFIGGQTLLDKIIDLQFAVQYLIKNGYGLQEDSFFYLKKGFCLIYAGHNSEALQAIKSSAKIEPSSVAYFMEAVSFENSKKHDSALHYYSKALAIDNDIFDAHKKRAIYRCELKDWKGAYSDFEEMIRIQPNSGIPYRLRGEAKFIRTDYYGTMIDLTSFLKTDSTAASVWEMRSMARNKVGDLKGTNEDLGQVLRIQPGNWLVYKEISHNDLLLKDTVSAITIYEKSKGHVAAHLPFLEQAGLLIQSHQWESAQSAVDTLRKLFNMPSSEHNLFPDPIISTVVYYEGRIKYHHSLYKKAIERFSRSLGLAPGNLEVQYFRAKANEKLGNRKKALADLTKLRAMNYLDSEKLYNFIREKR